MGEVFLEAFTDTLIVLPLLLIMNFIIELLEYRSKGLKANKILKGGLAPLIGATVGVLPQCGVSVVATELYGKRKIALGTLLAVYIATSDEALPIMLSGSALSGTEGLIKVLSVLLIKICFALVVGYTAFGAEKLFTRKKPAACGDGITAVNSEAHIEADEQEHVHDHEHEHVHDDEHDDDVHVHIHGCHHHDLCGEEYGENNEQKTKKQKAKLVWNMYLRHPLIHTATVILYIFIVNVAFGITVYYVGMARFTDFIGSTGYLQPLLAAAVGLIPNCAGSVVITELYVVGGLNLGGAVAGLCVSAGIGYAVLVKQNRPIKNTLYIIALMFVLSAGLGTVVTALGF